MSERFTVVFDDPELYRRLKVWAAEHGLPLKQVVQDAIASFLGPAPDKIGQPIDWEAFDRWQKEVKELDKELGIDYPIDLAAGRAWRAPVRDDGETPALALAEDRRPYDE